MKVKSPEHGFERQTGNFNLLDEAWIPVLYRTGKTERIGICKTFEDAHLIRQIAASNPMDRVAILRFLLALLYWCKGNPLPNLPDGSFPQNWFNKLDDNKDCFNLLGEGKRFYQDCNAKRPQAVTHLIQEIPAGNNFWHFKHSTDKSDGLCPACCAMGLLRLPLFSVSGLSGPGEPNLMAGINGVPPIYVMPFGNTVKETLLANWTPCSNLGEPSWVNPNSLIPDKEVPILAGLTLLSRRVLLHEPDGSAGTCIGCGSHEKALIRTIEFQTAGKQENDKWDDPHVVYTEGAKRKAVRAEDLTKAGKFRMDRPWADLLARIVETGGQASLLVVGFATNKAKNIDVWERTIELPSRQEKAAERIKRWQEEGQRLAKNAVIQIKRLEKTSTRKHIEIRPNVDAIRPHVEGRVSAKAGELVAEGDDAWEQAAREYSPMMKAIARSLSPGFMAYSLERRRQIASIMPDMQRRANADKKRGRKRGGDK